MTIKKSLVLIQKNTFWTHHISHSKVDNSFSLTRQIYFETHKKNTFFFISFSKLFQDHVVTFIFIYMNMIVVDREYEKKIKLK